MDDTNALIEQRKAKLAALRAKGIDPFKNKFAPTENCAEARANYAEGREVALAGRITAHRDMGKSQFIDIKDGSGAQGSARIQVYAQKQALGDEQFDIFKHLDLGDFVGVRGAMFTTKTGEISVKLTAFVILAKTLRPPPAKWHGLEDTEIRYRQRYLDLMSNDEVKNVFLKRSQIIAEIRNFLHSRGFVEVETPMMQAVPGGAAAQPFVTQHKALGCNFYLRIALELYLKRMLVGGIDRVFEIGRIFRNEGLSRKHNPEFTMLEAYQAYGDYESMMELVQSMICHVAEKVLGTLIISRAPAANEVRLLAVSILEGGVQFGPGAHWQQYETDYGRVVAHLRALIDLPIADPCAETRQLRDEFGHVREWMKSLRRLPPDPNKPFPFEFLMLKRFIRQIESLCDAEINLTTWKKARYKDLVREAVNAATEGTEPDWFALSSDQRRLVAMNKLGLGGDIAAGYEDFEVTGAVFEKLIEPTLIQPTFVTHLPKELVPLAKLSPDDPTTVEVFECCINGQEIAPAYTEQNDPLEQRERREHQAGGEQQKLDEDFLVALEHGMPPAGGMGMGIDRLCMMLLGQESIRDVILFPQLKPK